MIVVARTLRLIGMCTFYYDSSYVVMKLIFAFSRLLLSRFWSSA